MVMHIIYIACEFGFYQLPADILNREVSHLLDSLPVAVQNQDTEMVGEVLDCLETAGKPAIGPNGLEAMHSAKLWLVSMQQKAPIS